MRFGFFSKSLTARLLGGCSLLLLASLGDVAVAAEEQTIDTARFTLHFKEATTRTKTNPRDVALHSLKTLDETYTDITRLLEFHPTEKVVIRFLSPEEFHRRTGAPEWTSAMYLRGEISIPLSQKKSANESYIERAVRHEYVHAVTAEISGRNCPAWIDEGLAQLIEGDPNPLLGPALRRWLATNDPMPLDWLNNGFTTMTDELVPAAYAQSLFATRLLVDKHGYKAVKNYLQGIKSENVERQAFREAFGYDRKDFEMVLKRELLMWAKSDQFDP